MTAGNVIFCSMLGYALAKLSFPGKRILFALVLGTLMVPANRDASCRSSSSSRTWAW